MSLRADSFDLGRLKLISGEGRRLELEVEIEPFELGGEEYRATPALIPAVLDISRTTGEGYALRLRFEAALDGPCMRCLGPAAPAYAIDVREISQPGEVDELDSPYVAKQVLDLRAWARDALALALPTQVLCRSDCAGLCPICGAEKNAAGPDHVHEPEPDPRWAKLSEIQFD
jgi:uncharacterized protein